jgi:hypothetical protein
MNLCENCQRRPISKFSPSYCMICGVASDTAPDAEAQKSPALDGVNDYMERREGYVRQLEAKINELRSALGEIDRTAKNAVWDNPTAKSDYHAAALTLPKIRTLAQDALTA